MLARADTDREALAAYREVLIDYLQRFVEEVRRYEPLVVDALERVDVAAVLARTGGGPRLLDIDGTAARRSPGLQAEDWSSLQSWFCGATGRRSDAEEVRALATRAMGTLLAGLRRAVAGQGQHSRRAALLRLAGLFDHADDVTAHRLWDRAFGLFPARHLSALPEVADVPATTSWWDSTAADVPLSLREYGDRAARGRSGRREDFAASRARRLAERDRLQAERDQALRELAAHAGRPLRDVRVSDGARTALLELYAQALAGEGRGGLRGTGGCLLRVRRAAGATTTVRSPAGTLRLVDLELTLEALDQTRAAWA